MKTFSRVSRNAQRGLAAVEMALILPILVLFLVFPLFLGRVLWYYTATHKAAHDAVRFLSSTTQIEMQTLGQGGTEAPVAALARAIAAAETNELLPLVDKRIIDVQCDLSTCGGGPPATVRVFIRVWVKDPIFSNFTSSFIGDNGLLLKADVTMSYVGI